MLKNALVTGASAGLGRELVRQLVRDRGMTVVATARRRDRLEELAAELPPGRVLVEPGDLTDPEFRQRLWLKADALPGGCDLLVNNAGMGHYARFWEQDPAVVREIVALNLIALMDLTRLAAASMVPRGSGQILEISSILGFVGLPYASAYVATKHAVNGLVKSLAYELRGTGVRVWAACPARTLSEFSRVALANPHATGRLPSGQPTEKVVRGIVRGIDRRRRFVMPTWLAAVTVGLERWLPGPYEFFVERWLPGFFQSELDRAHGPQPPVNSSAP